MKITNTPYLQVESSYYSFADKDRLSAIEYKHILDTFGILLYKALAEKKEVIKLPYGMGNLYLKSTNLKSTARQVDYHHFVTTGEIKIVKRNHLNLDGYLRTIWDKRKVVAPLLGRAGSIVQFKPNRAAKRRIHEYIRTLSSLVEYHK